MPLDPISLGLALLVVGALVVLVVQMFRLPDWPARRHYLVRSLGLRSPDVGELCGSLLVGILLAPFALIFGLFGDWTPGG